MNIKTITWIVASSLFVPLLVPANAQEIIKIGDEEFTLKGDLVNLSYEVEHQVLEKGLTHYIFRFVSDGKSAPKPLEILWKHPLHHVVALWTPERESFEKPGLWRNRFRSRAPTNAPVIALFGHDNENRYTYACSDALNAIEMSAYVDEYSGSMKCGVGLFMEPQPPIEEYTLTLRIDKRDQKLVKTLSEVAQWWESLPGYRPSEVPGHARLPMYSTWYAFHQDLPVDEVVKQCEMAKQLGMESIIVDDGWQTIDSLSYWYVYTGDWKPVSIPDMKGFVDRVHGTGLKFLLWYSIPFMGLKAENFDRFKGKYLYHSDRHHASVLDPRFPEVRDYLITTFKNAIIDWDVDGFKLDFIDRMYPTEETVQEAIGGRDYASVNEAIDRLMTDIMEELKRVKPNVMIEFRQAYIGPLMRKYGNMFRAGDCPNGAIENKVKVLDLRMISGNTAVHSDMIMWHRDEPVEGAALQLLNVLYSVPQVSVKLDEIHEPHKKMLAFWLSFWRDHQRTLLDGELMPYNPEMNYPMVSAETEEKKITTIYVGEKIIPGPTPGQAMFVVNATPGDKVLLKVEQKEKRARKALIYTVTGELIKEERVALDKEYQEFRVPPSGLLHLTKPN